MGQIALAEGHEKADSFYTWDVFGMNGLWNKPGVYTTDEFDPDPYMEALNKWGLPWKVVENPVLVD